MTMARQSTLTPFKLSTATIMVAMTLVGTGCATSKHDTTGTAAVDRMYQHYANQTVQAFNRLNGSVPTDTVVANRPLVEQAVAEVIDRSAEEALRTAAKKMNVAPVFTAAATHSSSSVEPIVDTNTITIEAAPIMPLSSNTMDSPNPNPNPSPSPSVVAAAATAIKAAVLPVTPVTPVTPSVVHTVKPNHISVEQAREIFRKNAPNNNNKVNKAITTLPVTAPQATTTTTTSMLKKQAIIVPATTQVLKQKAFGRAMVYLDKAADEGQCPAIASTPQAQSLMAADQLELRALALPITLAPYSGDIEDLASSIAQSIGYRFLPFAGTRVTPVIVTYGTTCRSAIAALQDISSLVGESAELLTNTKQRTMRWSYSVGNKAFAK